MSARNRNVIGRVLRRWPGWRQTETIAITPTAESTLAESNTTERNREMSETNEKKTIFRLMKDEDAAKLLRMATDLADAHSHLRRWVMALLDSDTSQELLDIVSELFDSEGQALEASRRVAQIIGKNRGFSEQNDLIGKIAEAMEH